MMRAMNEEEQAWVEDVARRFDSVVFWTVGRYGAQPLLCPVGCGCAGSGSGSASTARLTGRAAC